MEQKTKEFQKVIKNLQDEIQKTKEDNVCIWGFELIGQKTLEAKIEELQKENLSVTHKKDLLQSENSMLKAKLLSLEVRLGLQIINER